MSEMTNELTEKINGKFFAIVVIAKSEKSKSDLKKLLLEKKYEDEFGVYVLDLSKEKATIIIFLDKDDKNRNNLIFLAAEKETAEKLINKVINDEELGFSKIKVKKEELEEIIKVIKVKLPLAKIILSRLGKFPEYM